MTQTIYLFDEIATINIDYYEPKFTDLMEEDILYIINAVHDGELEPESNLKIGWVRFHYSVTFEPYDR